MQRIEKTTKQAQKWAMLDFEKDMQDFLVPGFLRQNSFIEFPAAPKVCRIIAHYLKARIFNVAIKSGRTYMHFIGGSTLIYLTKMNQLSQIVFEQSISDVIPGVDAPLVNFFIKTGKGELFYYRDDTQIAHKAYLLTSFIIDFMAKYSVCDVSVGNQHGIFLTEQRGIYVWGSNEYGQLGVGSEEIKKITDLKLLEQYSTKKRVKTICAIEERTFIEIDENNVSTVYGAGNNDSGQLGSGKKNECFYHFCKVVFDARHYVDGARVKKIVGTLSRTLIVFASKRKDILYSAGKDILEKKPSLGFKKMRINNKLGDDSRIHNVGIFDKGVVVAVISSEKQADTTKIVLEHENLPATSASLVQTRMKNPAIYDVACDDLLNQDLIITRSDKKLLIQRGNISSPKPLINITELAFSLSQKVGKHNC